MCKVRSSHLSSPLVLTQLLPSLFMCTTKCNTMTVFEKTLSEGVHSYLHLYDSSRLGPPYDGRLFAAPWSV